MLETLMFLLLEDIKDSSFAYWQLQKAVRGDQKLWSSYINIILHEEYKMMLLNSI